MTGRQRAHPGRRCRIGLAALAMLLPVAWTGSTEAQAAPSDGNQVVYQESQPITLTPTLEANFKPSRPETPEHLRDMQNKLYRKRLGHANRVPRVRGKAAVPPASAPASRIEKAGTRAKDTAKGLVVARNYRNFAASSDACGTAIPLAEPAAANDGPDVYYTGNISHQEFSTDHGASYECAQPYPVGLPEAPFPLGDTDVIYDQARDVTFHSVMYVNANLTNAVARVFVRHNIPSPDNCYYDVDFDPASTNVFADYPHLGLSKKFLFVSGNRISQTTWLGAAIGRLSLDDIAACRTASGNSINFTNPGGQRILVPGHGARNVEYFAWVNTPTQWRVFSWPDNSTAVGSTLHNVSAMTFGDADCRGGVNNTDWASPLEASIIGFNVRTAVTKRTVNVWVATDADAAHPNAHIVGAEFRLGTNPNDLRLVQEPVIAFADRCSGEPAVGVNDNGEQGLAIAVGGRRGGGGPAVTTAVGLKDDYSRGPGAFTFREIAAATHNPADGRYGDYFTVRRNSPCGRYFDATGYGLLGGTQTANVNARYVEFGRGEYCSQKQDERPHHEEPDHQRK